MALKGNTAAGTRVESANGFTGIVISLNGVSRKQQYTTEADSESGFRQGYVYAVLDETTGEVRLFESEALDLA